MRGSRKGKPLASHSGLANKEQRTDDGQSINHDVLLVVSQIGAGNQ